MHKNLTLKMVFILVLVAVAGWTLYPPSETLKPGIDLAGGTSLIYEIDTHGLDEADKKDLAQRMITVLRRRIDPANIQNLVWRPQGNTRFEIQMPLASQEARQKRDAYEQAETALLAKNVRPAVVLRSLDMPAPERDEFFAKLALDDPNRLSILNTLASTYDERNTLKNARDGLFTKLEADQKKMSSAGLDVDQIEQKRNEWAALPEQQFRQAIDKVTDANDTRELLTSYVKTYAEWSTVMEQFLDKDAQYKQARLAIDKLNLSADQVNYCLDLPEGSEKRAEAIKKLESEFPDRVTQISEVVAAYDAYRPFRGRLDDPKDLQRMLKGAGILEYRILPTRGYPEVNMDQIATYIDTLQQKGPNYGSDAQYIWCQIEDPENWHSADSEGRPPIIGEFGDKSYVLASNKPSEVMLHSVNQRTWKLERAYPTTDRMGRRAIGFLLDDKGGVLFARLTQKNIGRPLCILLDGVAISAPNIEDRIARQGVITGTFTQTQVEDMVNKLNAGSLPARLIEQPISVNTIGPSIGTENRDQGIVAGLIGLVAVIVVMLVYYILSGSVADVALLLNILFVLAIMAGLRATFTLPGIAGIILTIGMSVDANVLVFERIREEQLRGSSLRIAIANGYQRAFRTIFDANLTTFITGAILYWRASEEVKGFAIVLMLGIASSMFTALFVTRVIFDLLLSRRLIKDHLVMLRLIHNPNVNWMRSRPVFFTVSGVLIVAGLLVFFTRNDKKDNKYDIEFTGGTNVTINLKNPMDRQQVEDRIKDVAANNPALAAATVYRVGESDKEYEISTTETNKITVTVALSQAGQSSVDEVTGKIEKAQAKFATGLTNLAVTQDPSDPAKFTVSTSQMNQSLVHDVLTAAFPQAKLSEPQVDEVVNDAIRRAFAGELEVQENLEPTIVSDAKVTDEMINTYPELMNFLGGVKIECQDQKPVTAKEIVQRFKDLAFKPDMRETRRYPYEILNTSLNAITDPNQSLKSFIYVSAMP